jgi:uncharacterized membrane protein HdeD (DUF308 family)
MKRIAMALGILLLILGLVAFLHPNFGYHKHEEVAKIGPVTATVDKQETATVPPLVAGVLVIAGAVLIILAPRLK